MERQRKRNATPRPRTKRPSTRRRNTTKLQRQADVQMYGRWQSPHQSLPFLSCSCGTESQYWHGCANCLRPCARIWNNLCIFAPHCCESPLHRTGNNVEARFIAGLLSFGMYTDFLVFGHKKTPEIVKIRTFRVHFRVRFA